jgi:hypothetical protein
MVCTKSVLWIWIGLLIVTSMAKGNGTGGTGLRLLTANTRALLEKGIRLGLPPLAIAHQYGIAHRVMSGWLETGMRYLSKKPVRPSEASKQQECSGGVYYTLGELYKHDLECMALARLVCAVEGTMVSNLVKRMWACSRGNTDMMKFLFKQYGHVHGLKELPASVKVAEPGDEEPTSGGLVLYLPHNDREDPVVPAKGKRP